MNSRSREWTPLLVRALAGAALVVTSVSCAADAPGSGERRVGLIEEIALPASETPTARLQAVSFAPSQSTTAAATGADTGAARLWPAAVWLSGTHGEVILGVSVQAWDPVADSASGGREQGSGAAGSNLPYRFTSHQIDPELELRDIEAFSPDTAIALASGSGSASRIYRTDDAGQSWRLQWQGSGDQVFLDCLDFWDSDRGLVYGDSVEGDLFILRTTDGGASWQRLGGLPRALEGEGGFAASGDCLRVGAGGWAGIVTGAGDHPRYLSTSDYGEHWSVMPIPLPPGKQAGGFALAAFAADPTGRRSFAVGGDLSPDTGAGPASDPPFVGSPSGQRVPSRVVMSDDGGLSWRAGGDLPFDGAAYGLAVDYSVSPESVIVVGPGGVARSMDGGLSFERWSQLAHWAAAIGPPGHGLLVGPDRRVTLFALAR